MKLDIHHVLNAFNGQEVFHYMDFFSIIWAILHENQFIWKTIPNLRIVGWIFEILAKCWISKNVPSPMVCKEYIFFFHFIWLNLEYHFTHKKTESFEMNTREKKRNLCMKNNPRIHNANIVVICRFCIELYVVNDGRRPQSIEWRIRNDSPPNLAANISNTPGFAGMLRFQRFSKLFG